MPINCACGMTAATSSFTSLIKFMLNWGLRSFVGRTFTPLGRGGGVEPIIGEGTVNGIGMGSSGCCITDAGGGGEIIEVGGVIGVMGRYNEGEMDALNGIWRFI